MLSKGAVTQFTKKYSSYIFLLNQGKSTFEKELVYKGICGILFCCFVLFHKFDNLIIFF